MRHPLSAAVDRLSPPSVLSTRFGELAVDPGKIITLAHGLLGFEHRRCYVLADIAPGRLQVRLLQAVDDERLSFLVAPLDPAAGPIARADLEPVARAYGYGWADLLVLGIVTLRPGPDGVEASVNLRAPVLIDSAGLCGHQHVFGEERYDLRHRLLPELPHAG